MSHLEKPGKDHVGVCVGAIVVDTGWVLLLKRKKEPERGRWCIQGGTVELDEERTEMEKTSSIRTARREDLGAPHYLKVVSSRCFQYFFLCKSRQKES